MGDYEDIPAPWKEFKDSIWTVDINCEIELICHQAFAGLDILNVANNPSSVNYIQPKYFFQFLSLSLINVSVHSQKYTVENGVLFNKENTVLAMCQSIQESITGFQMK